MLYDDAEQVEVRHVIALYHYDVGIYGGGEAIPEGELYIRRNAISLMKRAVESTSAVDHPAMRPFFFFSDNCSEKEDFYLALLQQHDGDLSGAQKPPSAQRFEVTDMISLLQRLHSSEEKKHTRWINAMAGRLFLALYKTSEIEQFVRSKLTKKIARVKKPAFLSDVVIQKIDLGEGPPYITNPRMKDINVDGSCSVEMDVDYSGNFKIQVATKARIELGSRFKAREVDLVLSVVLKKLDGHAIVRFKPPPSNRIWVTFVSMPKMEMSIEPIVSSRQITYNIILRAIESRIREVVAETAVFPNWDDIPFADTMSKRFRGGIWAEDGSGEEKKEEEEGDDRGAPVNTEEEVDSPKVPSTESPEKAPESPDTPVSATSDVPTEELLPTQPPLRNQRSRASSTAEKRPTMNTPKSLRPAAYASAGTAIVGTDTTTVDAFKENRKAHPHDAASRMIAISSRAQSQSPSTSPVESPFGLPERPLTARSHTSLASNHRQADGEGTGDPRSKVRQAGGESTREDHQPHDEGIRNPRQAGGKGTRENHQPYDKETRNSRTNSVDTITTAASSTTTTSTEPRTRNRGSLGSMPGFGNDPKLHTAATSGTTLGSQGSSATASKHSLASLGSATASVARKWGWRSFNKNGERDLTLSKPTPESENKEGTPAHPIGRGRPLPPPGTPLPMPEKEGIKRALTAGGAAPKRKPVASSILFKPPTSSSDSALAPPVPKLENQRQKETSSGDRRHDGGDGDDDRRETGDGGGLLVVAAPPVDDLQPSSPLSNTRAEEEHSSSPPFEPDDDRGETRSFDARSTRSKP